MNNWTIALLIVASAFTVCTVAVCVLLAKLPPGSIDFDSRDDK